MPKPYKILSTLSRINQLEGTITNRTVGIIPNTKELLTIKEGTTFNIHIDVYDKDTSTAADLSNFTCFFIMANSKSEVRKECSIEDNKVIISISPADTIGHRYFNFEVRVTDYITGDSYILSEGNIKIDPSIGVQKQRETIFSKPGEYSHIADGGVIGTPGEVNIVIMDGGEL